MIWKEKRENKRENETGVDLVEKLHDSLYLNRILFLIFLKVRGGD